jgi:hypothetical protein
MPGGKPAEVRCIHLTQDNLCPLFGTPARPLVCSSYQATAEFCGTDLQKAMTLLADLEAATR